MRRIELTRRGLAWLVLATAVRPALADLSPAGADVVRRVEAYFDSIQTLAADFRQLAPDGSESTGKLYIDRGRAGMRFDYDPPSKILLVAPGDWRLIFYDGTIQQVNVIPIGETPLGFLLNENVKLAGEVTVEAAQERAGELEVVLRRTDAPDQGQVVLTLTKDPLRLSQWGVTDAQGLTTIIILSNLQTGMPLDRELFRWRDPQLFGFPKD